MQFRTMTWYIHIHSIYLFRINTDFQNYLRTQTGNNTTVNIIISTVDYLLRVQVRFTSIKVVYLILKLIELE